MLSMRFQRPACRRLRPDASRSMTEAQSTSFMGRAHPAECRGGNTGKVFGPGWRCHRSRLRPLMEGSTAVLPVEGRTAREARVSRPGAAARIDWRVAPDAGASAGDGTFDAQSPDCAPEGKHWMPSACRKAGPRIGESGVGSDAGPICIGRHCARRGPGHPRAGVLRARVTHQMLPAFRVGSSTRRTVREWGNRLAG